jgi:hypothetical protein
MHFLNSQSRFPNSRSAGRANAEGDPSPRGRGSIAAHAVPGVHVGFLHRCSPRCLCTWKDAGMAALDALIDGGVFDLFPDIRAAIIETAGGWVPAVLDHMHTYYLMSPGHVPNLKRMPREVIAEGRYFHGIDNWERSLEFRVEELGEDMWAVGLRLAARRHRLAGSRAAKPSIARASPRALAGRCSAKTRCASAATARVIAAVLRAHLTNHATGGAHASDHRGRRGPRFSAHGSTG